MPIRASRLGVVGHSRPKLDSFQKATGQALFTDDVRIPGMLHGKVIRSPVARGRIAHIDVTRAERLPGVIAVLTHRDTGGVMFGRDQKLLCDDTVNYIGDEVAAVAALDEDTAAEAASLVKIDYEELPAVFTLEEAIAPDAPQLHAGCENNYAHVQTVRFGDPEKAFAEADHVRVDELSADPNHNCFAELHVVLADHSQPGKVSIWTPCQSGFLYQERIAECLGLSAGDVRLCYLHTGGAFSGRMFARTLHVITALLSRKASRPVKIKVDVDEEYLVCRAGGRNTYRLETGVTKDGVIKACRGEFLLECGAYLETQFMAIHGAGAPLHALYRVEAAEYTGRLVYTNNIPYEWHHGGGMSTGQYAFGQHLDLICQDLGMDPLEFQLKNAVEKGHVTPSGTPYASCGLKECIRKAARKAGWKRKYGKLPPYKGIGIGCGVMASGTKALGTKGKLVHDTSAAFIKIGEDGKASLFIGLPELGQGAYTTMAMIAAETLGILADDITVVGGDTDIAPFDVGAFGQRGTFVTGNAVKVACEDAKKQIAKTAARKLGVKASGLVFRNRKIHVEGEPRKAIPFAAAVHDTLHSREGRYVMGRGFYNPPTEKTALAYSFGAQVAEVEVDPETGNVRLTRMTVAHDVGRALNPRLVEGQIDGQVFSAAGQILYEHCLMDHGQVLNASREAYKLPRPFEVPEIDHIIVESIDPYGPYGAKEVGEGPIVTSSQTIANAVSNAIGYPLKEAPITPARVLQAIRAKKKAAAG